MTEYSEEQFMLFLEKFETHECHVIELNAFAADGLVGKNPTTTANCFADSILKRIPEQSIEPNIEIYGSQKINVPFTVQNWNRVDVYFFVGKERQMETSEQINYSATFGEEEVDSNNTETELLPEGLPRKIPDKNQIVEGVPIVTPINFIGGRAKITKGSYSYLIYLKNTMQTYPQFQAHIRGHVCCGNKMSISMRRARTVYKYLVKNGISKDRLSFKGYSNTKPLVYPEKTQEDREANRRVDIIFTSMKP
jgi:outer membrane protein OmpA-like peptidoglycan-associated protein